MQLNANYANFAWHWLAEPPADVSTARHKACLVFNLLK